MKFLLLLPFQIISLARQLRAGYYMFGFREIDSEPARYDLEARDLPVVDSGYIVQGGGGYAYLNDHLIIGGEGSGGAEQLTSGKFSLLAGSGGGMGYLGWMIRIANWFRLYPFIGIGGSGGGVTIFQPATSNPFIPPANKQDRFDIPLTDPLLVTLGIGFEFHVGPVMFGARVGYTQSPFNAPLEKETRGYLRSIAGWSR